VLLLQLFTRKYCLEISGMRMRRVTWNWFPVKKFADRFNSVVLCRLVTWIQIC